MGQVSNRLPVVRVPDSSRVWLVGAHGGAGVSTIRASSPQLFADAGRAIPTAPAGTRLVVCAMATGRGLVAARDLLRQIADGAYGEGVKAVGLACTCPYAKTPKELREAALLVGSSVPVYVRLPFIAGLDVLGFPDSYPKAYARLAQAVADVCSRES